MKSSRIIREDTDNIIKDVGVYNMLEKLQNKTFLITGASGMVGSYFVYTLDRLNKKYDANIRILANVRDVNKFDQELVGDDNIRIVKHDVIEKFDISEHIDYIVHAASPASPLIMKEKPFETNLANTLGCANTLMLAKENNVDGYLFVSSREIYGEPEEGMELFSEDGKLGQVNPLVPRNGYAEGKKAAENMCISMNAEYGINTKIVRLAHTYGPGMSIYDGRVQADFLRNVLNDENIVLKSDGSSVRTYTYIADAVCGMFKVLLDSKDIVYNIADENSKTSIRELAEILVNIYPEKRLELVFDIDNSNALGNASFKNGILSTKKIRSELGWEPRYSIEEGFERTLEHLKGEKNKVLKKR